MSIKSNSKKLTSDYPIESYEYDLFDRKESVERFVQHVINVDCGRGLVVGIFSPWGNGKTSFLNLAKSEFDKADIHVFEFNPWMFSDADQLVSRFFREIASEMKSIKDTVRIGKLWEKYGDAAITIIGSVPTMVGIPVSSEALSPFFQIVKKSFDSNLSTIELRECVASALNERENPIIVVLDDVDRLSTPEIKDIFKLVRLTANFPNLIYILLLDRERVEQALQDEGITGREYLEKIIQIPYTLPMVPRDVLDRQLKNQIDEVVQFTESEEPDPKIMADVYPEIIFPLIRNMRDVRRYVAGVNETISTLSKRVSVADLLALEAVRLFLPNFFKLFPDLVDEITFASARRRNEITVLQEIEKLNSKQSKSDRINSRIEELYECDGENNQVVHSLVNRLFLQPFNDFGTIDYSDVDSQFMEKLLHDRRVAHRQVLCCYLERVDNFELREYYLAKQACHLMNSPNKFEEFLCSLSQEDRFGTISQLWMFTDSIHSNQMISGIVTLLNLLTKLIFESDYNLHDVYVYIKLFITRLLSKHLIVEQLDNLNLPRFGRDV